jgi:hypothetical protein
VWRSEPFLLFSLFFAASSVSTHVAMHMLPFLPSPLCCHPQSLTCLLRAPSSRMQCFSVVC